MDNIFISILSIISLLLLIWIFYLKYNAKYTREKYAFASLFAFLSLAALGVSSVLYQTPWAAMVKVIATYSGVAVEIAKPHWSEQVLIIGFLVFIMVMIQRTFSQWNNTVSVKQHKQQQRHEEVLFLFAGFQELQRHCTRQAAPDIYIPIDYDKQVNILEVPSDSLAWKIKAIELLTLRWHGYYHFAIEQDKDWHSKVNCWIGKNIKESKTTAVFCSHQQPSDAEIKTFVAYVQTLGLELSQCELLLIVQQGEDEKQHCLNDDIKIQQYSEAWLLDSLVDFTDYFLDLKKRAEVDCLPDSDLVLPDIYVPSAIKDEEGKAITEDLESYLSQWLAESGQRQLALLGEYGQGKSTGTLMFSHHLVQQYDGKPPRIPVLLELRGKSPKTLQPLELLSVWAGRLLLIFEGFDEMAEVSDAEARYSHFRALWRFCYPKAKILITGRPNFFLDDRELKALLGVDSATQTGAYVQALHLQPFSAEQIKQSLRHSTAENRQEICQLATEDNKFYDIVARPSLLYIVNQLWEVELKQRKHDINSAEIIGMFIKHSYKRQSDKSQDGRGFMVLTEAEREYFMDGIAVYMAKEKLPNQISVEQFSEIVEELYAVIPEELSLSGNDLNSDRKKPLKVRLQDNQEPLDAVKNDVRTYGVLVKDLTRPNTLKFPHKSFLEYLFANYVFKRLVDKDNLAAIAIWKVTAAEPEDLLNLLESLEFTGELLRTDEKIKNFYANKDELQKEVFNLVVNNTFLMFVLNKLKIQTFINILIIRGAVGGAVVAIVIGGVVVIVAAVVAIEVILLQLISLNKNKIKLWFLLSLILEIKQKDMQYIYGEQIAKGLPELAKELNADYLLEKYHYDSDD